MVCTFERAGLWGVLTSFASLQPVHWQSVCHEECVLWKVCQVTNIWLNRDINRKAALVVCANFIGEKRKHRNQNKPRKDWEKKKRAFHCLKPDDAVRDPDRSLLLVVYPKLCLVAYSHEPHFWESQVIQIWECPSYFDWPHFLCWWLRDNMM